MFLKTEKEAQFTIDLKLWQFGVSLGLDMIKNHG